MTYDTRAHLWSAGIGLAGIAAFLAFAAAAHATPIRAVWAPASGPVDRYEVEISRDGGAWTKLEDVAPPEAGNSPLVDFEADPGETIRLRVRAVAADPDVPSVLSPESDAGTVLPEPLGVPGKPVIVIIQ